MSGTPIIQTTNLKKEYPSVMAVKNVNLTVNKGEVLGLVGPNGAGKTTLLKMLATLSDSTEGSIHIMGMDMYDNILKIRANIGYLPDFFNLYDDLKIWELLYFFAQTYKVPESEIDLKINIALEETDLSFKRDDFIKNLSRGMTQRLGLATLLVHEPEIFLLDEPASGLDPQARIALRQILRKLGEKGRTIIISSHILTELDDFCSHIAIMNKGKMILHEEVSVVQKRLTKQQILRLKVLNDNETTAAILADIPELKLLSSSDGSFNIEINGGPELIAEINAKLVKHGVKVTGLHEERGNLEDIFMYLTEKLDLGV